jgi:hypothetical protein
VACQSPNGLIYKFRRPSEVSTAFYYFNESFTEKDGPPRSEALNSTGQSLRLETQFTSEKVSWKEMYPILQVARASHP